MPRSRNAPDIEEDIPFQYTFWLVQRVGWIVMGLLVLMGVLGVAGQGILSDTERSAGDAVIKYEKYARNLSPVSISVSPGSSGGRQGLAISVSRNFLASYRVRGITPEPIRTAVTADSYRFEFDRQAPAPDLTVTYDLEPQTPGLHRGSLEIAGGGRVALEQFVYP